jgi:hypothetical protein
MFRNLIFILLFVFYSCTKKSEQFSFVPTLAEKPLLVSEVGKSLNIMEVKTKYPISGTPTILKSDRYFYLYEEGIVYSLHQVDKSGEVRKSVDFGFDDKLNANAITQIFTQNDSIGIITFGQKITWLDENLAEIGEQELPVKAKVHFRKGLSTIAHTNGIDDSDWDIITYGPEGVKSYLPLNKNQYNFYNQTFSSFSDWGGKTLFSQAFNDTIYVWDHPDFKPLFKVDFGGNAITQNRYSQIQDAMDMLELFNEKKYSYLQGEVYGLDEKRILFRISHKGKQALGLMDFNSDELKIYRGLVDNSISGLSLFAPQFTQDGMLYFGVSGEQILENYDRLADSFKNSLSEDYAESYFIFCLELKD